MERKKKERKNQINKQKGEESLTEKRKEKCGV